LKKDELNELTSRAGLTIKDLLNPKSSGFRKLGLDLEKIDENEAARLIEEHPKIMRRPLLTDGSKLAVGFDPDRFSAMLD